MPEPLQPELARSLRHCPQPLGVGSPARCGGAGAGWKRAEPPNPFGGLNSDRVVPSSHLPLFPFHFPFLFSLPIFPFSFHFSFPFALSVFPFTFRLQFSFSISFFPFSRFPSSTTAAQGPAAQCRALPHACLCHRSPRAKATPHLPVAPAAREREAVPAGGGGRKVEMLGTRVGKYGFVGTCVFGVVEGLALGRRGGQVRRGVGRSWGQAYPGVGSNRYVQGEGGGWG